MIASYHQEDSIIYPTYVYKFPIIYICLPERKSSDSEHDKARDIGFTEKDGKITG